MSQKTPLEHIPLWEYRVPPPKMTARRAFKVLLYLVGLFVAECSLLGISFTVFGTAVSRFNCISALIVFGTFGGSLIYFFRTKYNARCLSGLQYLWLILGATIGAIILIVLEEAFVPNPNDKQLPTAIFGCITLLYGTALASIAHLKPSLHQQINESVRNLLQIMSGKQLPLTELIARLQKEYELPDVVLYQHIEALKYLEQIDIPGTNIKVCRIKGAKIILAFPQVANIATPDLRQKVARTLSFLNEENVDIGLFLLSKEFEVTLKTYLLRANAKGKVQIPTKEPPDRWKLQDMIDWVRKNGIITDLAVLNYLRQTRNDRAHGGMPSLAEKQTLMMGVQYLADLYIDYIKFFDDLTYSL